MDTIDLQSDIEWIHKELDQVKDPDLIEAFKRMLQFRKKTQSVGLEQYNREIKEAEDRIEQGQFLTQDQVEKRLRE